MRYTQLRAFHYVAALGGFSRAAEALNLSQPAISDQVRRLEEAYDILLFDRSKRQIRLTEKGAGLLKSTNQMFDAEAQALDYLNETSALESGTLRLFVDSAYHVTPMLKAFQTRYPKIAISLRVGNSEDVIGALLDYTADIGVVGALSESSNFEVRPIGESPLIAFAAKAGAYGGIRQLSYEDLTKVPLVLREKGSRTRQKLEAVAGRLRASIVAEGREAVREIVAAGNGIGFVSTAEFGRDERLQAIKLPNPPLMMQESLICMSARRERRLIKAFMAMAAREFP